MASHSLIEKRKRPDGRGLWGAHELSRDAHGTWLYSPKGSLYRGEFAGDVRTLEVGQGARAEGVDVLHLAPSAGFWFAHIYDVDGDRAIAIDLCTPVLRIGRTWSYVDLELDLFKRVGQEPQVTDEDEFDAAVAAGLISELEVSACRTTANDLLRRLGEDDLLPGGEVWKRLDAARRLGLGAATEVP